MSYSNIRTSQAMKIEEQLRSTGKWKKSKRHRNLTKRRKQRKC